MLESETFMILERAYISEIFSSVQGEGIYLGLRHLFVRFCECNLECSYCDSSDIINKTAKCSVETKPGSSEFKAVLNPLTYSRLNSLLFSLDSVPGLHSHIAVTGGEPLLQFKFLKQWLPSLQKRYKILLETNGILWKEFEEVVDLTDIISMDIKLPSVTETRGFWDEHMNFLKIAAKKEVYVKVVVDGLTSLKDIQDASVLVSKINERIPFVIQPLSPRKGVEKMLSGKQLMQFQEICSRMLKDVRIIPQIHKFLKIL